MQKEQFPIFKGKPLVYLDSAATAQKPISVIDAMSDYYKTSNANTGRSAYGLAEQSTQVYEEARLKIKDFIHADSSAQIIFTRGATESINIIANAYGMQHVKEGDEIAVLISEHHANLLPWQHLCKTKGAKLTYLYLNDEDAFSDAEIEGKITEKTKIVACAIVSNVLGIHNPIEKIIQRAHQCGAVVVVDAAQAVSHMAIDVQKLDADFLVFSAHKMYGPMGIGVLYGKKSLLQHMEPVTLGGGIVTYVYEDRVQFADAPQKFEAGTQNVAGAVGLAASIDFLQEVGLDAIGAYLKDLTAYAEGKLKDLDFVRVIGQKNPHRSGILSLEVEDIHPHDLASILDSKHICIRAGNHCAQPLLRYLNINATARASFGIYNNKEDVDQLIHGLIFAKELFSGGHSIHV